MATYTAEQARAELARRASAGQTQATDAYPLMLADALQRSQAIEPVAQQDQPPADPFATVRLSKEQAQAELARRMSGESPSVPEVDPDEIQRTIIAKATAEGRYHPATLQELIEAKGLTDNEKKKILAARITKQDIRGKTIGAALGAVQGATFGFADEGIGLGNVDIGTAVTDPSKAVEQYRQGRDEMRAINQLAQQRHENTYLGGEIAGGLATAAAPGGVPATLGRVIGTGAIVGGVSGLGASNADLTKGEFGQAAKDTALGAAIGAAGGAAAYGAGRIFKAISNRLHPQQSAANDVAAQTAQHAGEMEGVSQTAPRKTFFEQSMDLQKEHSQDLGEPFRYRPGQSTGDPALALAEMKAANFPRTMAGAQAEASKQTAQSARLLDMYVDRVAADPASLGRSDVGNRVVDTVENHISNLAKERSAVAKPLYDQASELAGGKRIITTSATRDALAEVLDANKFAPKEVTSQVRDSLLKVQGAATNKGMLTIDDMQNLRSLWGSVKRGDLDIIKGLSKANQTRIARDVLSAIDADLETAANGIASGAAADTLRAANTAWAQYSQPIKEASTDAVKRILKVSDDAGDTITSRVLRGSPDEIRGTFRVLNKADPDVASQLRAQLLDDIFTKAGKPLRGGSIAAEEGITKFSPLRAKQMLADPEVVGRLTAAFEGDVKAQFAVRRSIQLLKRVSFGPGIKGSTTAPQLAEVVKEAGQEAASRAAGDAAGGGITGAAIAKISKFVMGVLGNEKAMNEVYSNPQTIDLFNEALQAQLSGKVPKAYSLNAIAALSDILGLQSSERRNEQSK